MGHAETLLLVDDHKPQVRELDVLADKPVRADEDVDFTGGQPLDDLFLFFAPS